MKKNNRAKTQESLENIGLARSGTDNSAEPSSEQPIQSVPGNRALQALQMRAARTAGLAQNSVAAGRSTTQTESLYAVMLECFYDLISQHERGRKLMNLIIDEAL